jgi:hypothetical protein
MLPVAHGWYSAIYKAFMALRLKPLVPLLKFVALILFLFVNCSSAVLNLGLSGAQIASQQTHLQQNNAFPTASYVDEPLEQLLKIIPEITTLQSAQDQTQLAMILEHCGKNVDMQFKKFSDLAAKEIVSEIRVNPTTDLWGQPTIHSNEPNLLEDQYTYFVVREGTLVQTRIREYRRNRYGSDGAKPRTSPSFATVPGMTFLSANFASSLLYFSSDLQGQARFRYLGEQELGVRTAYVVAFAQVPGVATVGISMRMPNGDKSNWLVQGIAWIDKSTFEILQMRTDLLVPLDSSSSCQQRQDLQTLIQFAPVRPNGVADMMWLPTEADVHETLGDCKNSVQIARNVHHFSEYRRYGHEEANVATPKETAAPGSYAGQLAVHPYLELPLTQLMKRIPKLKGISPAPDQQALSMILQQTGKQVDAFFANLVDLIAHEDITQKRLATRTLAGGMPTGTMLQAQEHTQDSYLILRRTANGPPRIEEFRMDAKGNRMNETGVQNGFFITAGFALSSIHFATGFQWDSRFLYLGNQKIDGHDTYVVAFAQLPSEARVAVTLQARDGSGLRLLSQGIAWVDKASFHIRRLRTDLLAPQPELGLAEQTTTISYGEVRFTDAAPLWLPRDVDVNIQFTEHQAGGASDLGSRVTDETFRNIHHYSNYLLYRVSTKIGVPQ